MILRKKKWSEDEINILQTLARNITLYRTHQGRKAIYESEEIPFISQ
jgi:hypothetical protein